MKKFFIDFGGEEEESSDLIALERAYLPRYIITGGDDQKWATEHAKEVYQWNRTSGLQKVMEIPPMWLVKILIVGVERNGVMEESKDPTIAWSIATDDKNLAKSWYYIDTEGKYTPAEFPAVVGMRGVVRDSSGKGGVIQVASDLIPAPWWDQPSKSDLLDDIVEQMRHLSSEDVDTIADRMHIAFARGTDAGRKRSIIIEVLEPMAADTIESVYNYIQDYIDDQYGDRDEDDEDYEDEPEEEPMIDAADLPAFIREALGGVGQVPANLPPRMTEAELNVRTVIQAALDNLTTDELRGMYDFARDLLIGEGRWRPEFMPRVGILHIQARQMVNTVLLEFDLEDLNRIFEQIQYIIAHRDF